MGKVDVCFELTIFAEILNKISILFIVLNLVWVFKSAGSEKRFRRYAIKKTISFGISVNIACEAMNQGFRGDLNINPH